MAYAYDELVEKLDTKAAELQEDIAAYGRDMRRMIDEAKQNDILIAMNRIMARLDRIEESLSDKDSSPEEDAQPITKKFTNR